MAQSAFTAPHVHFFSEVVMDRVLARRDEAAHAGLPREGRPSVNDFIIKACASTLRDFPYLNASLSEETITVRPEINIGIAVAIDGGLVIPVIRNADTADLASIAGERARLVTKARAGRLTSKDTEGGTFTISSLARYGVQAFTAIINPPQTGILTVGATQEKPLAEAGQVRVGRTAVFGLAVDHRIVDGEVAARFLSEFKRRMEAPDSLRGTAKISEGEQE